MQPLPQQQQQRNRSLSLAAGRFSFSTSHAMRPKSSGGIDAVPEDGNRRHNLHFCSLPIRRTGESVRKLLRRASQSLKLHPNNGKLSMQLTPSVEKKFGGDTSQASSLRSKSKAKATVTGDSESGFFQDVDDCFYASDTLAVRRGNNNTSHVRHVSLNEDI